MQQMSLFDLSTTPAAPRGWLDAEAERLLECFASVRSGEGASRRSVLRECSQLRAIARACSTPGMPTTVAALLADLPGVARALLEPPAPIARATGRARLVAVQRFLRIMGPAVGHDPAADLATLDALLPARPALGWHSIGTLVAGEPSRRRLRGPALDAADLHRILDAAAAEKTSARAIRDRALMAVQCFSGLRVEEAITLCWEDVRTDLAGAGRFGLTATVQRGERSMRLLLPGPIGAAMEALRTEHERTGVAASGPVFRASGRSDRPLSYRGARKVLVTACSRAGLPAVGSAELRAGCAHWLRSQGLSEHEVAVVLGLARVRSVDRLLSRHSALDAQRRLREHSPA